MHISINQACKIWDDLRDAMEGKASHGHTAEIYAYRLMPCVPSLGMESVDHTTEYRRAAESLVALMKLFVETYPDCHFFIDDRHYHTWLNLVGENFHHRVQVEARTFNTGKGKTE